MNPLNPPHPSPDFAPSKTVSAWLALVLGGLGVHRYYLGAAFWWIYPLPLALCFPFLWRIEDWLTHPLLLLPVAVILFSTIEAIVFALTPDAKWDARYRPAPHTPSQSGWGAVWVAIIGLMFGAGLLMSMLAIHIQRWLMDGVVR